MRNAIILPPMLQCRLEAAAGDFLRPDRSAGIDFSSPAGEGALTDPDSVSWRVFKNPLSLYIGGITAVILELAEPRVRTGVWTHTSFRQNPLQRLQRTGLAAMMTVYGPRSRAEAMIAGVTRIHARIGGITPDGQAYRADDPELLDWVHATAGFGFLQAYHAYVHPLQELERERYYAEGRSAARMYGAQGAPASQAELDLLFHRMQHKLEPSSIIFEFLDIMQRAPLLPRPFTAFQGWFVRAAIALLPATLRSRLELDGQRWRLPRWQRALIGRGGALLDRIPLGSAPPVQACRRMGLPDDYLYRR